MTMHLSFEFFPAKSAEAHTQLLESAKKLNVYKPDLCTVTYGAGSSTRAKTFETLTDLQKIVQIPLAAHLSCIGSSKAEIKALLQEYQALGIKHIVALRGDIPSGMVNGGEFNHANQLVEFIRHETGDYFKIAVAAYPEMHPQATNPKEDLIHFVNKVKAGADLAFTQYFYHADAYYYFLEQCQAMGVDIPIIPGIMPITNYKQLLRFSDMCGAEIPRWIKNHLAYYDAKDDKASLEAFGIEVVSQFVDTLISQGIPGLHFYTMNRFEPTHKILSYCRLNHAA